MGPLERGLQAIERLTRVLEAEAERDRARDGRAENHPSIASDFPRRGNQVFSRPESEQEYETNRSHYLAKAKKEQGQQPDQWGDTADLLDRGAGLGVPLVGKVAQFMKLTRFVSDAVEHFERLDWSGKEAKRQAAEEKEMKPAIDKHLAVKKAEEDEIARKAWNESSLPQFQEESPAPWAMPPSEADEERWQKQQQRKAALEDNKAETESLIGPQRTKLGQDGDKGRPAAKTSLRDDPDWTPPAAPHGKTDLMPNVPIDPNMGGGAHGAGAEDLGRRIVPKTDLGGPDPEKEDANRKRDEELGKLLEKGTTAAAQKDNDTYFENYVIDIGESDDNVEQKDRQQHSQGRGPDYQRPGGETPRNLGGDLVGGTAQAGESVREELQDLNAELQKSNETLEKIHQVLEKGGSRGEGDNSQGQAAMPQASRNQSVRRSDLVDDKSAKDAALSMATRANAAAEGASVPPAAAAAAL